MGELAIKIEGISKKYTVGKKKDSSLRGSLGSLLKSSAKKGEDFWALKDVSFEVKKGEVIGIVGKNGAGKSTLLKILSQITKPTEGRIEIYGRVASLLEVGTGFHPELTGRENIYLNGTILGMTRKEVKEKFDEIVAFSGVEKFIDTPVKHYSSGMYVRLAFAVAAHLEPEILIIDEVLAVGDSEFQQKCLGKMKDVAQDGRTVIFVSHNMGAVQSLCNSAILIEQGKITMKSDSVNSVVKSYLNAATKDFSIGKSEEREGLGMIRLKNIELINSINQNIFSCGQKMSFLLSFIVKELSSNLSFLVSINSVEDGAIFFLDSEGKLDQELKKGENNLSIELADNLFLYPKNYYVNVAIKSDSGLEDYIPHALDFDVISGIFNNGKDPKSKSTILTNPIWKINT